MKAAHDGKAVTEFARPGNIVVARVDPATGLLAPGDLDGAREEEFLAGTEPTETSPEPEEVPQGSGDAGAPQEIAAPEKPAEPSVAELPPF
jgi:membrane carboxypeptidase/penicillin-binding protein